MSSVLGSMVVLWWFYDGSMVVGVAVAQLVEWVVLLL